MKKIGVITTNRVLAQSLSSAVSAQPELQFDFYPLLIIGQALIDAEVLKIDVALIDVINGRAMERGAVPAFCEALRRSVPSCRIMLLVSQNDRDVRQMAISAMKNKLINDFVFYDTSLDYLLAKLSAI